MPYIAIRRAWRSRKRFPSQTVTDPNDIQFLPADPFALFRKLNYKVRVGWGIQVHDQAQVTAVLDTGDGTNLVNKDALLRRWIRNVRRQKVLRLTSASRQPMQLVGVIPLFVHLGDLCFHIWFVFIDGPAVPAILGTSFTDLFVMAILPQEQRILPYHSRPISILSASTYDEAPSTTLDEYNIHTVTEKRINKCHFSKNLSRTQTCTTREQYFYTVPNTLYRV